MTRVALLVLCTPAEATLSERTFSVSGAISKRRGGGKLKPSTLSNLTMLQRITRNRLDGKTRLTRAKRSKIITPAPLATTSLPSAMATPLSATAESEAMDDLSDEFEARLQADAEQVEAMINAGELAFMVGEHGAVELLEQNLELQNCLELLSTSSVDGSDGVTSRSGSDGIGESDVVSDDDEYSLDKLLSAFSGGAAVQSVGSVTRSAVEEVP